MSRDSFILHQDSLVILERMTDNQAGQFIKIIYNFQKTGYLPTLDFAMEMAIAPFLNQFKRDNAKYHKSAVSGRIGNLKKYHEEIYNKYAANEISLVEAEERAYPYKKEINSRPPIAPDHPRSLSVSDSVSVNVNDSVNVSVSDSVNVSDITITPDKPKKSKYKYNDFQFQIAEQLGNHIKYIKNINLTIGNIKKWASDIRLLQEQDLKPRQDSQGDIIKAMQSILDNSGKEYFPIIESGSSFRSKFSKIENYKKSAKPAKKTNQEIYNELSNKYKNQDAQ